MDESGGGTGMDGMNGMKTWQFETAPGVLVCALIFEL
jgi:hypothetical protein